MSISLVQQPEAALGAAVIAIIVVALVFVIILVGVTGFVLRRKGIAGRLSLAGTTEMVGGNFKK